MSKFLVTVAWADVPHLSEQEQAEQLAAIPPYQRDARTKGIPYLGSGAIYPFDVSDITVQDFRIPDHWPRGYGMDVGWNRTAAPWGAHDREADIVYLYSEHYMGEDQPPIHASAIKSRGKWIPGMIDPAANGRSQIDGKRLLEIYRSEGLILHKADNAVEAGIFELWTRLSTGRLKVFNTMVGWLKEFRMYHRDEKGQIVKRDDHLMDATRYLIMGLGNSKTEPVKRLKHNGRRSGNWMAT